MKSKLTRNSNERSKQDISYWLHDDDSYWKDIKVKSEDVRFPQYTQSMNSEPVCYHISELNTK